jgi:hypothetical protein
VIARDQARRDIFSLRDVPFEDMDNRPSPEVIAQEIVKDVEAALAQFAAVAESLGANRANPQAHERAERFLPSGGHEPVTRVHTAYSDQDVRRTPLARVPDQLITNQRAGAVPRWRLLIRRTPR